MCQLWGLAFNKPVTASISFRGFQRRGEYNPDGWGLAWFSDGKSWVRKEAKPAHTSQTAGQLLKEEISSKIFIGHVRLASCGIQRLENTHPFQRAFSGTEVVFAHNGTFHQLPYPARFMPEGDTDSERVFCLLLDWIEEKTISFSDFYRLEEWLRELNGYGTMNLLFSDGRALFAYRDINGYNGLCFTYRQAPFPIIRLRDEDWEVDLTEEKRPSEKGFVIATKPLTDERWYDLAWGRLFVIRDGEAVYGDPRE